MTTSELRDRLVKLSTSRIKLLAKNACVGERTLWNIRSGDTLTAREDIKARLKIAFKTLPRKV